MTGLVYNMIMEKIILRGVIVFFRRLLVLVLAGVLLSQYSSADESKEGRDSSGFADLRQAMVKDQIQARGVTDQRVLKAMLSVERHLFVPKSQQKFAYSDSPLPIGENQTISQPYIVALMTELLDLDGTEKILEIGTGSGYQAAVLGEVADTVFTIEIIPVLAHRAESLLTDLGYDNIVVKCGDGYLGWPEHAPFDAIIVTCAPSDIPQPLLDQLANGGRMVIPVGVYAQELVLVKKHGDSITRQSIIPVRFVPMTREKK